MRSGRRRLLRTTGMATDARSMPLTLLDRRRSTMALVCVFTACSACFRAHVRAPDEVAVDAGVDAMADAGLLARIPRACPPDASTACGELFPLGETDLAVCRSSFEPLTCAFADVSGTTPERPFYGRTAWAAPEGGTCSGDGKFNLWIQEGDEPYEPTRHPAVSGQNGIWVRALGEGCGPVTFASAQREIDGATLPAGTLTELVIHSTGPVLEGELRITGGGWDVSGRFTAPICQALVTGCP